MTTVQRMTALDSCALSDALDTLGISGVALGLHAVASDRPIAGEVITRHLCTAAVDAAGAGTVIVVAHHGRTHAAGWGGVLSAGAVMRKVEGVVVDGAVRDLDEARQFGLALYAATSVPVTARGRIVERAWNVPVEISGITVLPGDYVCADGSGIVFIPRDRIEEVLVIAERIAAKESEMLRRVRGGEALSEVMGGAYETMLDRGSR